ncbi:hypothetical protein Rs2_47086 [Raphanus sativus]|uniref:Uncharacterized protein LOC108807051 n=1 Tax=Raphanus sativus TaxID=3726 RepID=A0A6J0JGP7_RAPSA|nr:uncharacterized protein LOC108807051 [Raphanus sativus]KAJ4871280.1 hypothetical protein Rs2_47086 [Raphanus sativus]
MASSALFKFHSQTFKSPNPSPPSSHHPKPRISHLHFPNLTSPHSRHLNKESATRTRFLAPLCSSLPSPSSPPVSKEEAILQAKTCLSSCLVKPLNNPKLASPKLKKLKQPRFRLEIPILDDDDGSPSSLTQLAFSIFSDMPISRRGSNVVVKLLFLWPDPSFIEPAVKAFRSDSTTNHIAMSPVSEPLKKALKSADVAVFMAPERSQLEDVRLSTEGFATKPVVMINPRWLFEEEKSFGDDDFVGSFDVIYAFTGLEVRGILSKRKGVIFKCVRDGVVSGERWNVLVEEEEGDGALKVVSQFKARPSMEEVELVLYNLMAMNSPITKSAKFLKDLVSNITGKK